MPGGIRPGGGGAPLRAAAAAAAAEEETSKGATKGGIGAPGGKKAESEGN